jgi:hypothetical protein
MHTIKWFLLLLVVLFALSCKCRKQAEKSVAPTDPKPIEIVAVEKQAPVEEPDNIIISFTSRGEGIDRELMGQFQNLLADYREQYPDFVTVNTFVYGREGETEFCIYFVLDDPSLKERFLNETGMLLIGQPKIFLVRGGKCRK